VSRVAAIGGGHGLARALGALRLLGVAPTAIVTVADDGGSSGRLRRDLGIIAPGDLRMALLELARQRDLARVLAHRFDRGELEGHALGNLLLVALAEQDGGDWVAALDRAAGLLDCAGRVLPSTSQPVALLASTAEGVLQGQVRVTTTERALQRVWLEPPDAVACPAAVQALLSCDVVVLAPGSLFTSILPNLLVHGIARAVVDGGARVVYVANLATQRGETSGLDTEGHIRALLDHVPGLVLHTVVLHDGPRVVGLGEPLGTRIDATLAGAVATADLAARDRRGQPIAAHDPRRLADTLAGVLASAGVAGAVTTNL